jgi:hypothetical protein
VDPVVPDEVPYFYSLPPNPIPLTSGSQLLLINSNSTRQPIKWTGLSPDGMVIPFGGVMRNEILSNISGPLKLSIEDSGSEELSRDILWVASPMRSKRDFIDYLMVRLGWWMRDDLDPRFWDSIEPHSQTFHPDVIAHWIETIWFRRLEQLACSVRFLLGYNLLKEEFRQLEGPYLEFLESGDGVPLIKYLLTRPETFLAHWADLENLSPSILWNQLWLHWSGTLPTAQQLLQMNSRFEAEYLGWLDDWHDAFVAFLWDFQSRRLSGGSELIFLQPAPHFEEEVVINLLEQLIFTEAGIENGPSGDEAEDLIERIWIMFSHEIQHSPGFGWMGSVNMGDSWYWHSVYGWIYYRDPADKWHFSEYWGWFAPVFVGIRPSHWFYLPGKGWFWTSESVFPWLWSMESASPVWSLFMDYP